MASPHETLAYCAQSLSMARISVFGGGNSAERDPPDKGHFVVQPTGSFQQPLRRCAQLVLCTANTTCNCTWRLAIMQHCSGRMHDSTPEPEVTGSAPASDAHR